MPKHVTIPITRAWNSWSDRPGELVFLPLGLRITPVLYSSRLRRCSKLEPRTDAMRLGRHAIDGSLIEFEADFAGTTLGFSATKPDPFAVRGSWRGKTSGEWGLRFWVTLAIWFDDGAELRHDPTQGITLAQFGDRHVAIATGAAPVQVTGHASLDDLCQDYETNGYFHRASRATAAPLLALRFNLEMMRDGAYAAAVADSPALASAAAKAALAPPAEIPLPSDPVGEALEAIRDIVAWNTVWDEQNARPYTAVTRIWNLGTFAVWHNDQTYAALLAGLFDADLARENLATALASATPQGNFACIVTSRDAWVDRSQPPIGSLIAWQLYQRTGEQSILAQCYPAMARNQRWWRAHRDPGDTGLLSCGSSDVGAAFYKGTAFAARNETGMDNSATHDEALYDPVTGILSTWDLGLNCVAALDAEMLARIAAELGHGDEARAFDTIAERSRALISRELWDESRRIFANRQRGGGFVRSVSPTSFYPLLCGAASPEQAANLLAHLSDPRTFAGDWVLPNATRDDPAFADNVYWRGRIWPNVNYLVWLGLRRSGFLAQARQLADQSLALFRASWQTDRIAAENYNATTGAALDQGDTDPFYIWSALLPLITVAEVVDVDPWRGLTLANDGRDIRLGPVLSPYGRLGVGITDGVFRAHLDGRLALSFDFPGILDRVLLRPDRFTATLRRIARPGHLVIHPSSNAMPALLRLGERTVSPVPCEGGIAISITPSSEGEQVDVIFTGPTEV